MKISHGTRFDEMSDKNGYGYATVNMLKSLARLGYEVNANDATADVEIWFDQPQYWNFSKGTYKIGYLPWESTALFTARDKMSGNVEWLDVINQCDELWTPSPLIAKWYSDYMGVTVPVFVYEHGVDPIWTPKTREVGDKFKFLHLGGEAVRKGAKEAMQAMRLGFPKKEPVELDLKIISPGWNIGALPRVNILNTMMGIEQLVDLFHSANAYVYPSYGEGFGLTPLQAMATGMPTITVPAWAPYAEYLDPNLCVDSSMIRSPWPALHPGFVLKPNLDDVIDAMRYAYNNYDQAQDYAQSMVPKIQELYSWDYITSQVFEALEKRLKNI